MNGFICRVLSIQHRKNISFLFVSGFPYSKQLMVDNRLIADCPIGVMSVIKGQYGQSVNNKGEVTYQITKIDSIVSSNHNKAFHKNFTNKALLLRLCKNDILNQVKQYLESNSFQAIYSPFTIPYRGTSIASPLKISGKYVNKYCKITHEFFLKKEMAENLIPVYEIGYVARDVYSTISGWYEYSILEFVSPIHNMDFVEEFICKFIDIAVSSAKKFGVSYNEFSEMETVILDDDGLCDGKCLEQLKSEKKNVMFINCPVSSPLVKKINGKRTETIWFYNGESMAHGYWDENDFDSLFAFSKTQMELLNEKGIDAEYSKDFLSLLNLGTPESVSIGFGLDRFFQIFFGFANMKEYRDSMCHSGEY